MGVSPARPRLLLVLGAVCVLGWLAARATEFRERLVVRFEAQRMVIELDGREFTADFEVGAVTGLRVRSAETFEQFGGGKLEILEPPAERRIIPLPARWRYAKREFSPPPVGDWWVDRSLVPEVILAHPIALHAPFAVAVELPGRVLEAFRLTVDGERSVEIGLRIGLLNNDLYVSALNAPGFSIAWAIGGPWQLDLRRSFHPFVCGITLGAALCLVFLLVAAVPSGAATGIGWLTNRRVDSLAYVVLAGRLAISCWIAWSIFQRLPTFQDDLNYYLRADWLLHGQFDLSAPPPDVQPQLQIPFTDYKDGRWYSPYPINWPLLLAAGMALGLAWLVAPVCATIGVWALYAFAKPLAGARTALLAVVLLATSPFCLLLSGSMMSHAATSMCLGLFALGFVRGWTDPKNPRFVLLLGAGAALGFAFGIRPLTAAAVGLPTLLFGLWEWRRAQFSMRAFGALAIFALGVFVGMGTMFIDNTIVTGKPFLFAYAYREPFPPLMERLLAGTFWSDRSLAQLPMLMSGWGWPWLRGEWWLCLPFGFAVVPFLLGRATRHDWFALGLFLAVVAAHYTHHAGTIHAFGPRIYIDTLFALFYLAARGFQCLAHSTPPLTGQRAGYSAYRVAVLTAILLPASTVATLDQRLVGYRGYNAIDRRFLAQLSELKVPRALFLFRPDSLSKWIRAAPLLPRDLATAPYVFAELKDDNTAIVARYGRDRPVFIVNDKQIVPYPESAGP